MASKHYRITSIRPAAEDILHMYKELYVDSHPLGPDVARAMFDKLHQVKRLRDALAGKEQANDTR